MLERAGAQIITCHGRIREQRGQNSVQYHFHLTPPSLSDLYHHSGSRRLGPNRSRQTRGFRPRVRKWQYSLPE
jgi:hypothetical protein